jgi:hypothetical protein
MGKKFYVYVGVLLTLCALTFTVTPSMWSAPAGSKGKAGAGAAKLKPPMVKATSSNAEKIKTRPRLGAADDVKSGSNKLAQIVLLYRESAPPSIRYVNTTEHAVPATHEHVSNSVTPVHPVASPSNHSPDEISDIESKPAEPISGESVRAIEGRMSGEMVVELDSPCLLRSLFGSNENTTLIDMREDPTGSPLHPLIITLTHPAAPPKIRITSQDMRVQVKNWSIVHTDAHLIIQVPIKSAVVSQRMTHSGGNRTSPSITYLSQEE